MGNLLIAEIILGGSNLHGMPGGMKLQSSLCANRIYLSSRKRTLVDRRVPVLGDEREHAMLNAKLLQLDVP